MSVLRYISILALNLLIILESSSMSVVALTSEDIAVNSLDALSLPIETIDQDIASNVSTKAISEIKPELKLDIQSLLDANRAYREKNTGTAEGTNNTIEATLPTTDIFSVLGVGDIFGDFQIRSS
jgi:hypothetical protein